MKLIESLMTKSYFIRPLYMRRTKINSLYDKCLMDINPYTGVCKGSTPTLPGRSKSIIEFIHPFSSYTKNALKSKDVKSIRFFEKTNIRNNLFAFIYGISYRPGYPGDKWYMEEIFRLKRYSVSMVNMRKVSVKKYREEEDDVYQSKISG